MNIRFLVPAVLVAAALSGCQKQADEVSLEAKTSTEAAVVAKDCPVADENGRVEIAPGLTATILKKGYGRSAAMQDYADVAAKLWVYDETADDGKGLFVWESGDSPFQFQLGDSGLIDGWTMGIECMLVGERRELIIAAELAYGERGRAPIPPNAAIIYDLELQRLTSPE
ncbi:MAG: FKBP-type peptidyl-prolyl cis-trans isomerase [Gammaproteobacteria bacterium]|nr:FKBP-type peptidyl-prolyl cis-trans isomerase [Gammaproteobacteria bacterium]